MRRLLVAVVLLLVLVEWAEVPHLVAQADTVSATQPALVVEEMSAPSVTAKAYGVFDVETGELLLSHNAEEVLPIASVTKLFTAATVLRSERTTEALTITAADVATEGRAGKLAAGQVYTAQELLFPLLLESSNDAGAAITRTLGPATLAGRELADGTGLSARNQASVQELASSVRELYQSLPHIFDITVLNQKVGEYTGWINNSPVHDLPGYRGGKHGYTEAAGRTLVAIFAESTLNDRELGYVILGSADIEADTRQLREQVVDSVYLQ